MTKLHAQLHHLEVVRMTFLHESASEHIANDITAAAAAVARVKRNCASCARGKRIRLHLHRVLSGSVALLIPPRQFACVVAIALVYTTIART
jgi:hypothetical protein